MKRFVTRALIVMAATLGVVFAQIAPASATVHEIVAQWCSGHDPLGPPGISGGSKANNFAQPLNASGFIGSTVAFDPPGDQPAGSLITFNYDNPNAKVVGTGQYVAIGQDQNGPIYIELIQPNPKLRGVQAVPAVGDCLAGFSLEWCRQGSLSRDDRRAARNPRGSLPCFLLIQPTANAHDRLAFLW